MTYRGDNLEVWGRKGRGPGEFFEPRAVVVDRRNNVYVVDSTGRIQKFSSRGRFLKQWRMPEIEAGKPESLGIAPDDELLVPDTHYHRCLVFSPNGERRRQWGGRGDPARTPPPPGYFIFVNGMTATENGRIYTTEYGGSYARIQEFDRQGHSIRAFGRYGLGRGEFRRPGGPCLNADGQLVVCDSPNHRVQVFSLQGKLLSVIGSPGKEPGKLSYPYAVACDSAGNHYVAEWGNHRIQKFSRTWEPLATWGTGGTKPGELYHPWGVAVDREGGIYVADKDNHRVQKFRF